jgi:hypothetical protein
VPVAVDQPQPLDQRRRRLHAAHRLPDFGRRRGEDERRRRQVAVEILERQRDRRDRLPDIGGGGFRRDAAAPLELDERARVDRPDLLDCCQRDQREDGGDDGSAFQRHLWDSGFRRAAPTSTHILCKLN